ncbi:2-dehydropantoate 2-reductase [Salisediminibacterium halotolerans]|nr:2-dehydropantoate 2-reductase [Actinophytocola xinjiangensis]RPE86862.1 2-dehydropantoate 2-reductase [Salisediminibacterium halotolerans]TWG32925.1 2-dehydropantoate 2-reductase [Salisediminibacterium halotolerans]
MNENDKLDIDYEDNHGFKSFKGVTGMRATKILICGAGPFGSLFAERLTEAGHDVTLMARGERLKELEEHGVVIENSKTGESTAVRVPLTERLEPDDAFDLVIVTMRKNQALELLPQLAENDRVPVFLFMMNNASGFEELIRKLGRERVMIGFPLPGGARSGEAMKMLPVDEKNPWTIPLGEADGSMRMRTVKVAEILASMRGYKVQLRSDMDAWLKTHVALLIPAFVPAVYAAGTDLERFTRTRDARILCVRGIKEALRELRASGTPITPKELRILEYIPEPTLAFYLGQAVKLDMFKVSLEHLKAAPDEMAQLADEFNRLTSGVKMTSPALDQLSGYFDGTEPELKDGAKDIPVKWSGFAASALLKTAVIAGGYYLWRRSRKNHHDH